MANESSDSINQWPQESIPDRDVLFMRVHRQWTLDGSPTPGAFQDRDGGMSTDWSKYSTAQDTLKRARKPEMNGILKMQVEQVRKIPNQTVQHTPKPENRAHTDVFGNKDDVEVRLLFSRICTWAISPR